MKIIVFSDSHSYAGRMTEILKKNPADYILHLGDCEKDARQLAAAFPTVPLFSVRGNNDFSESVPFTRVIRLSGINFFMTHGHRFPRNNVNLYVAEAATEANADIALFGHTHIPCLEYRNGILLINPGSVSLPRSGFKPSYAEIEIGTEKKMNPRIIELSYY